MKLDLNQIKKIEIDLVDDRVVITYKRGYKEYTQKSNEHMDKVFGNKKPEGPDDRYYTPMHIHFVCLNAYPIDMNDPQSYNGVVEYRANVMMSYPLSSVTIGVENDK